MYKHNELLEKIKNEIAQEEGHKDWIDLKFREGSLTVEILMDRVAERYASRLFPTKESVEQVEAKEPTDQKILEAFKSLTLYSSSDEEKCSVMRLLFRSSEVKEQEIESDFKKDVESVCNKIVTMDITNTGDYRSGGECPFCRKDCRFDANDVSEIEHEMNCVYLIAKDLLSAPSK